MNWLKQTLWSSIGKKLMMAVTGLAFCAFLTGHLAGNLTIYGGKEALNSYAAQLRSLGPLITAMELGLFLFAVIHIITGLTLFYQNTMARGGRYAVSKKAVRRSLVSKRADVRSFFTNGGGRTIGSATMPYTGVLLLLFVVIHLINFTFVDKSQTTLANIVAQTFENPLWVAFYVLAMIVAAVHVSHGFWSAFQTIGANHKKYMRLIMIFSTIFSLIVGFGFGLLPIFVSLAGLKG
ncbi:MAG: succinate dehydrogenase cytochrome b subunit [Desulfobacterales bacterium]